MLKKRFHLMMVVFVTLFSLVFISVYKPFNDAFWLGARNMYQLECSFFFYISCLAFLCLSRFLLYRQEKNRALSLRKAIIWLFVEYVSIASIYIAFTVLFDVDHPDISLRFVLEVVLCVALVLVIPYTICMLYAIILDCREEIRVLKLQHSSVPATAQPSTSQIKLYDRSGTLRITAEADDIYYIDSQDNYVNVHYMLDGQLSTYLLRNSTTEVEAALSGTSIMRCHRSYMVNLHHIEVLKHSKGKAEIVISDTTEISIPVSRSYYKQMHDLMDPVKIVRMPRS